MAAQRRQPATHSTPPEMIENRMLNREATTPDSKFPRVGPRGVAQHLDRGQPAAWRIRDGLVPDQAAEHAAEEREGQDRRQLDQSDHANRGGGGAA